MTKAPKPKVTMINAKPAEWDEFIWELWEQTAKRFRDNEACLNSNYFTTRPYVDQWNSGSSEYGFTYTAQKANDPYPVVCQMTWIDYKMQYANTLARQSDKNRH